MVNGGGNTSSNSGNGDRSDRFVGLAGLMVLIEIKAAVTVMKVVLMVMEADLIVVDVKGFVMAMMMVRMVMAE